MESNRAETWETPVKKGRMAVFIGSTPNIGTTSVMMGTAARLVRTTDQSVAVICLNFKSSKLHRYLGREEVSAGLDGMRAGMKSRSLNPQRIGHFFEQIKGASRMHVLFGTLQREQAEYYMPGDIRHLFEAAREAFDVCLVEVNAYWDNAGTITALLDADEKVAVTTPDLGHFQEDMNRGLKSMSPLFGIKPGSFHLVVNQYGREGLGGMKAADIRKECGMELAAVIGYDPELRDWLNRGKLMEYAMESRSFAQSVEPLADELGKRLGLRPSAGAPPARGIKRWIPSFSGS